MVSILRIKTLIAAPPARCFDLARSVDAHLQTAEATEERAAAGRTTGLLTLGDQITLQARHLGICWRLSSRITVYDRPSYFQDRMVRGPFTQMQHDHTFTSTSEGATLMTDELRFAAPCGLLGRGMEKYVLTPHLRSFLEDREKVLKQLAESEGWKKYLPIGLSAT